MQKYAVIDLGTNTFHLLIVAPSLKGKLTELHRERIFVKLAEEGIDRIAEAPFERGLKAMRHFKTILNRHEVTEVKAFGTAALRTATNAPFFIQKIKEETDITVDIIGGEQEARLIYQGVKQIVSFEKENGMIMDIGGGSVEFVVANKDGVIWSASFPIGVAVLTRKFHQIDPIPESAIQALRNFLDEILKPLQQVLSRHKVTNLIGASGTFDVLEAILAIPPNNTLTSTFPVEKFAPLHDQIISTTLEERFNMTSIPDSRAEMIVTALILIRYILDLTKASKITVSAYAMKEGMLAEMFSKTNK